MGFGFNLLVFPFLIIGSAGLLALFYITKKKFVLLALACIWGFFVLLFIMNLVAERIRKPTILTKEDLVGVYRIDTSFYPGKNARWQYQHYQFELTSDDSLQRRA